MPSEEEIMAHAAIAFTDQGFKGESITNIISPRWTTPQSSNS